MSETGSGRMHFCSTPFIPLGLNGKCVFATFFQQCPSDAWVCDSHIFFIGRVCWLGTMGVAISESLEFYNTPQKRLWEFAMQSTSELSVNGVQSLASKLTMIMRCQVNVNINLFTNGKVNHTPVCDRFVFLLSKR